MLKYYPITEVKPFSTPQGRGSCYQQFASQVPLDGGGVAGRFCVIFDEDIDTRVFDRIETILRWCGERPDALFVVAERKGSLTVVFRREHEIPKQMRNKDACANALISADDDYWPVEVFQEDDFYLYAGCLSHPAISKEAFIEATTWKV